MAENPSDRERGIQLLRQGSAADSVGCFLKAIAEDPTDVDAHLYLGVAFAHQNEIDKAVDILEQAVDIAPTSAKVHRS